MMSFLWSWTKRFRSQIGFIAVLGITGSLATLVLPWLAAQFLSGMIDGEVEGLTSVIVMIVAALIAVTALNIGSEIASEAASGKILSELRQEVYSHLQLLPLEFHDKNRHGDLLALTTYDVQDLSGFLTSTVASIPAQLLAAGGAMLILLWIDPLMALLVPLLLPAFFILTKLFGRRLRAISSKLRKAENDLVDLADTDLSMLSAIKSFAVERPRADNFAHAVEKARRLSLEEVRSQAFLSPIATLIASLGAIAFLVLASERLAPGQGTPESLFAFIFYTALLTQPIGELADVYGEFRMADSTLLRLKTVLSMPNEPGYTQSNLVSNVSGDLTLENVTFGYQGRPLVFDQFSLGISAGSIVAITGNNGAGKSTLVRLLLGLYSPESGKIMLDGQDISHIQVQSLRRQYGYVPQRALLFNGTIAENIAFGTAIDRQTDGANDLKRAIALSQAKSFINALPDGINTVIGDNGVRLSGGQRQKVALARALFKRPPIYILDEATSMYDNDSEAAFIDACVDSLRGHTVILITHRPASLALADRVIEL